MPSPRSSKSGRAASSQQQRGRSSPRPECEHSTNPSPTTSNRMASRAPGGSLDRDLHPKRLVRRSLSAPRHHVGDHAVQTEGRKQSCQESKPPDSVAISRSRSSDSSNCFDIGRNSIPMVELTWATACLTWPITSPTEPVIAKQRLLPLPDRHSGQWGKSRWEESLPAVGSIWCS